MAFLSGNDLTEALKITLGDQFNASAIKQAAYQLSLGEEYYRTDSNGQIENLDSKNKLVEINAGQFCLLLTEEVITVPHNLLGFISIKANEKFKGLINVSGFHLDPGFHGRILFSVYNAGPSTISLQKGEQYFLLWLSQLSKTLGNGEAYSNKLNTHQNQNGIPPRYIDALKRGELASPSALLKKIEEVETEFAKRHARHEVTAGVLLTIVVGLGLKFFYDNNAYERGYEKRVKEEMLIHEMRVAKELSTDTNLTKIDSLNSKLYQLRRVLSSDSTQ